MRRHRMGKPSALLSVIIIITVITRVKPLVF